MHCILRRETKQLIDIVVSLSLPIVSRSGSVIVLRHMSATTAMMALPSKTYDADAVRKTLKAISIEGQKFERNEQSSHDVLLE